MFVKLADVLSGIIRRSTILPAWDTLSGDAMDASITPERCIIENNPSQGESSRKLKAPDKPVGLRGFSLVSTASAAYDADMPAFNVDLRVDQQITIQAIPCEQLGLLLAY